MTARSRRGCTTSPAAAPPIISANTTRPRRPPIRPTCRRYADARPNAGDEAGVSDDHAFLHRALNRLDRDDREILLLSRFQELSFAEIAGILECSVGAAKVRAHRASASSATSIFNCKRRKPHELHPSPRSFRRTP